MLLDCNYVYFVAFITFSHKEPTHLSPPLEILPRSRVHRHFFYTANKRNILRNRFCSVCLVIDSTYETERSDRKVRVVFISVRAEMIIKPHARTCASEVRCEKLRKSFPSLAQMWYVNTRGFLAFLRDADSREFNWVYERIDLIFVSVISNFYIWELDGYVNVCSVYNVKVILNLFSGFFWWRCNLCEFRFERYMRIALKYGYDTDMRSYQSQIHSQSNWRAVVQPSFNQLDPHNSSFPTSVLSFSISISNGLNKPPLYLFVSVICSAQYYVRHLWILRHRSHHVHSNVILRWRNCRRENTQMRMCALCMSYGVCIFYISITKLPSRTRSPCST